MANTAKTPEDIWQLHDFLMEKRKEIDEKYDYRYSILLLFFGRLAREGWKNKEHVDYESREEAIRFKQLLNYAVSEETLSREA